VQQRKLFQLALALPLATWILLAASPALSAAPADDATLHTDDGHQTSDSHTYDNGHKNAGASSTDPKEFKTDLALYTLAVFLLLLLLLYLAAWPRIVGGLQKREQGIADQIEQARLDAEQAAVTLQEYKQQLQDAVLEAQQIVAQARQDAETAGDRIVAEARQSAERERDRALDAIDVATRSALDEVAQRGTEIAVDLAGKIISKELNADDHASLIRDSIDQFASNN
jgi:F-type H+-transporting ATPase subunit b